MRRGNKFHAKRSRCNKGHTHASGREARRCNDLHFLQIAGEIAGLEIEPVFRFVIDGRQVKMRNGHVAQYRPDFVYTDIKAGCRVAEDVKSDATMTEAFALRAALFRHLFPSIELRIVK